VQGPAYTSSRLRARATTGCRPAASIEQRVDHLAAHAFVVGGVDAALGLAPAQVDPDARLGVRLFREGLRRAPVESAEARRALDPRRRAPRAPEGLLRETRRERAQREIARASGQALRPAAGAPSQRPPPQAAFRCTTRRAAPPCRGRHTAQSASP
jgi:hypothetical protein